MREAHLRFLVCPACRSDLALVTHARRAGRVETGALRCARCALAYPIEGGIPRFVPPDNYARGFGLEWKNHARTQYDSATGRPISRRRFFDETGWPEDLRDETILEVGCGSGRFTEPAASTGAMVVSLDYSAAVEANFASHGDRDNVLIVQGDLYRMPFRAASFDRLFCFGVLQHTPDVEKAFLALPHYIKVGGRLAVDVYREPGFGKRLLSTKHWVRPLTRRIDPERLYRGCRAWVHALWPITRPLARIPRIGKSLCWALLVADYTGVFDLPPEVLKEWAVLDTFDMLSPAYDSPQTLATVEGWFRRAGLAPWEVRYGHNGIEGRGVRLTPILDDP